ncbi:MAG: hypothetical protein JSR85_09020 [Proteobacteria bacterium]|nr:hypothetical protein [Pseudomonadota bacterium]
MEWTQFIIIIGINIGLAAFLGWLIFRRFNNLRISIKAIANKLDFDERIQTGRMNRLRNEFYEELAKRSVS